MIIKNGDYNFIPCDNNGNSAEIIPNSSTVLNRFSEEEIFDLLYKGIFLDSPEKDELKSEFVKYLQNERKNMVSNNKSSSNQVVSRIYRDVKIWRYFSKYFSKKLAIVLWGVKYLEKSAEIFKC